jgi:hypothetical protein
MFQWLHQICTKFLEGNHSVDKRFEEYILCYLTLGYRLFLKLKYKNNRAVDHIVDQYKRAIKIVNKYQNAEIKLFRFLNDVKALCVGVK